MKLVKNYNDFMYQQLLEGMKLKISKGELILSKKLKEILGKMNHQIADDLIAIHRSPEAGPDYKKSFPIPGVDFLPRFQFFSCFLPGYNHQQHNI